jgi:hypothetical protein
VISSERRTLHKSPRACAAFRYRYDAADTVVSSMRRKHPRRATHATLARLARPAVLTRRPFVLQTARGRATGAREWQITEQPDRRRDQ